MSVVALREIEPGRLTVAIDPGKAQHRVLLATGERGVIGQPVTVPVAREGIEQLGRLIAAAGGLGPPLIGIEATGSLHRAWAVELERRYPGSVRLLAPSEDHGRPDPDGDPPLQVRRRRLRCHLVAAASGGRPPAR